ncbi:hypothetical protein LTR62_001719 [Meristemomyces frigidus]|uniref:Uncharacterized protein n=1 Tax=Meristemomyces frigidus TaxID=1508187 RepID=A0AAN7T7Y9_9PEZI|nr:hypothetical protein LTR62_001719 [Meristemomyces frigidus]
MAELCTVVKQRDPTLTEDYLFEKLPAEMRQEVFSKYLAAERKAMILPYRVDAIARRPGATRRSQRKGRSSIIPLHSRVLNLNQQARREYLPQFNRKVVNLDIDELVIIIRDLDFSIILDFLNKIVPHSKLSRLQNVRVTIRLFVTHRFCEDLIANRSDTSLCAWLQHRDVIRGAWPLGDNLQYNLIECCAARESNLYFFLNVFRHYLYANNPNPDLSALWQAFIPHFYPMTLSLQGLQALPPSPNIIPTGKEANAIDGYGQPMFLSDDEYEEMEQEQTIAGSESADDARPGELRGDWTVHSALELEGGEEEDEWENEDWVPPA